MLLCNNGECVGDNVGPDSHSIAAVEKPPISSSVMSLQSATDAGSAKDWSVYGPDGPLTPSDRSAASSSQLSSQATQGPLTTRTYRCLKAA